MTTSGYDTDTLRNKILSIYSNGHDSISMEESPVINVFAVNILKSAFQNSEFVDPRLWGELKPYSASCEVLQTICGAFSKHAFKSDLPSGNDNGVQNSPFHTPENGQKVYPFIEILVRSQDSYNDLDLYDQENIVGYRLWMYFKENVDLLGSVENAYRLAKLSQETRESKQRNNNNRQLTNVFERCDDFRFFFSSLYTTITAQEIRPTATFSFFELFNPEKCITKSPFEIDSRQRTTSTYFNTNYGCTANSLRRELFNPKLFLQLNISTLSELLKMPLPRFEVMKVLDLKYRLDSCNEIIENEKNFIETLKDQLTDDNKKEFDDHCELLEKATTDASNIEKEIKTYIEMSFSNDGPNNSLSILDKLKKFNPMIELRARATVALNELNMSACDMSYRQWVIERKKLQKKLFEEWKLAILNEKNTIPLLNAAKSIRNAVFKPRLNPYENMTPFANYIINVCTIATEYLTVSPNTKQFFIIWIGHHDCYRFTMQLRINLFLIGPPGGGKTEMILRVSILSPDGSWNTISHTSDKAHFVEGASPFNDSTVFFDEVSKRKLGLGPRGPEDSDVHDNFKNLLTSGIQNTDVSIRVEKKSGDMKKEERGHGTYTSLNQYNVDLTSNAPPELNKVSPIGSRTLQVPVSPFANDSEHKIHDRIYKENRGTPEALEQFNQHKLDEQLYLLVESLITARVILDVNITVSKWIFKLVFENLEQHGIFHPTERMTGIFFNLCRVLTIKSAINFLLKSEYSLKYSQHRNQYDKFDLDILLKIEKLLYCTEEIAIFVLTLIMNQLTDVIEYKVIDGIAKDLLPHWPLKGKNDTSIKFRVVDNQVDYNQIAINGSNPEVILRTIQSALGNSLSFEEIHQAIANLKTKPASKNVEMQYRFKDECIIQDVVLDSTIQINNLHINSPQNICCSACGENDKTKITNCKCGKTFCLPLTKNCSTKCIECSELIHDNCPDTWCCDLCKLVMHKRCRYKHGDLVNTDVLTRRIPVVEVVTDRANNQTWLYMATAEIGNNPEKLFNAAIQKLAHKYMTKDEQVYITANYISRHIDTLTKSKKYTFYDMFDVIKIKKSDNPEHVHVINNYKRTSNHVKRVLFDKKSDNNNEGKMEVDSPNGEEEEAVEFNIESDFDELGAQERLFETGDIIDNSEELSLLVPEKQRVYINKLREKNSALFNRDCAVYPDTPINEKVKVIKLLNSDPNRKREAFTPTCLKKYKQEQSTDALVTNNTREIFSRETSTFEIPNGYKLPSGKNSRQRVSHTDIY